MKQGAEGHILVVGGSGHGKSSGSFMPTLATWKGTVLAIDVKGELSATYSRLRKEGLASREFIVFDPLNPESPGYEPFWWLETAGEALRFSAAEEIADSLITSKMAEDDFWPQSERAIFVACLLYGYKLGLSFSETLFLMLELPLKQLVSKLIKDGDMFTLLSLNGVDQEGGKTFFGIERGLRNKVLTLAADNHLAHAFRGHREGATCFNWSHLDQYNIFLRIPENQIDQWSGAINLMLTQLIRHLERRPDKYAPEGPPVETLLLLDEFARFGKVKPIEGAMSTLRSKNIHICLGLQSVAQFDAIYGTHARRVFCDNADYTVLLGVNDPDMQKYFAARIGTAERWRTLDSTHYDENDWPTGTTEQRSCTREWKIFPEELAYIDDVFLLSPHGFFRINKLKPLTGDADPVLAAIRSFKETPVVYHGYATVVNESSNDPDKSTIVLQGISRVIESGTLFINENARMLTLKERCENYKAKSSKAQPGASQTKEITNSAAEKINNPCNAVIGELVVKHFPELQTFKFGTADENPEARHSLDLLLEYLAAKPQLLKNLAKARGCTMLF